jgi:hypothetical protein
LTRGEGRRFALTVGGAFLALAAILAWRDHRPIATVFVSMAGLLIAAGVVIPDRLGPIQSGWMMFAHAISRVTNPIVMGVVYFLILTPVGLIRRIVSGPRLSRARGQESCWAQVDGNRSGDMRRQF